MQKTCYAIAIVVVTNCLNFMASGQSHAGLLTTATIIKDPSVGVPFASPEDQLGPPWVSYLLQVRTMPGEKITAVVADIRGPVHHRWVDSNLDGIFETTSFDPETSSGDSHLTVPPSSNLGDEAPNELGAIGGSPLPNTADRVYGIGTALYGSWRIPVAYQSDSANIAYLVIPRGDEALLDIWVGALVNDNLDGILTEQDFFPTVPEPSTWILSSLCLASAGALRRR